MRVVYVGLLLAGIILPTSVVGGVMPWLSDDFDSYSTGSLSGQGGWTGVVGPVQVVPDFARPGKCAEADYLTRGTGDVTRAVSSGGGYHYVDFDAAMDTQSTGAYNMGYFKVFGSNGLEITRLYYLHEQFNMLFGTGPAVLLTGVQMRVWYHFRLGIDLDAGLIDVWVNGNKLVSGASTFQPAPSIGSLVFGQWNRLTDYTKSKTYIDNLVCQAVSTPWTVSWVSPNRYRILLTADARGVVRSNSPATMSGLDFPAILAGLSATGSFDPNTLEVVAYDASWQPKVFDSSRPGYEKYLVPHRLDEYYGMNGSDLSFVMPDHTCTHYAAYFDTVESGLGQPLRYAGIVGDGDWFKEGYKRREATAGHMSDFCDFDGDGDLDLFRVTVEPFIYSYENVGGNRMLYRGRMSSGGSPLILSCATNNRSWAMLEFNDYDNDGDQDLFPSFAVGPDSGNVVRYENTTTPGGELVFTRVVDANNGRLVTVTGKALGAPWFGAITVVDYDGDGKKDVTSAPDDILRFNRNIGPAGDMSNIQLADGVPIQAGGANITGSCIRAEFADIDHDGDLDMFVTGWSGNVYFYRNTGTRTNPVYAAGEVVATSTGAQVAVTPFDWDGDGEIELAVGQYWSYATLVGTEGEYDGQFGGLWKNIGTPTSPVFEKRDAYNGCPYTEQFQPCATGRQNGVRAVDWNNDGRTDLIAGDQWGYTYLFRNTTNQRFPVYEAPVSLMAAGSPISVVAYSRMDICDWNNDGKKDFVLADDNSWVWVYINIGTDAAPVLAAGQRLSAYRGDGSYGPIEGPAGGHASVLVTYWDKDTLNPRKDLILANSDGYFFYRNIGTDAAPVFAAPTPITCAPDYDPIFYIRPNVGSFVDWDGDGKPDFIGCEFEDRVWLYRNTSPWTEGSDPRFAAGVTIIQPWTTTQMVQGPDAKDWGGDGDLDIVIGQGHGGTGYRLYERDYVNDFVNNTYPVVALSASESGFAISEAKLQPDGTGVTIPQGVVTASFTGVFYVESKDRTSGIRVEKADHGCVVDQRVDVSGLIATNAHGERYIDASTITSNGSGEVSAIAMNTKALGGGDWSVGAVIGQRGVDGGVGLNNIGLLVTTCGRCTLNLSGVGDFYGSTYLFIDDGSGVVSYYREAGGSYVAVAGVKVEVDDASIAEDDYVIARGISSIELVNGVYQRRLLPRAGMGDVRKL